MKHVRDVLEGRQVWSVAPDMPVLEVARFMSRKRVGAVAVVIDDRPVGMFSERDLMERVVIPGKSAAETSVSEVMTNELVLGTPDDSPFECVRKMQTRGCRHLPIVEDGRLVGMVSMRDLLKLELVEHQETIKWMDAYIRDDPRGGAGR